MTKARSNATAPNAKGTLVVGNGTDASTTLAVASTAGYVLTVDSAEATGLKWAAASTGTTFIGARAYRNSAQNISHATLTAVEYNAETYDTDSFHSTSTNTSRFTIPTGKGGYYALHVMLTYQENSTGIRDLRFYKNGSELQMLRTAGQPGANALTGMFGTYVGNFAAGDYLECYAYQNSGGTLTVDANTNSFTLYKIGD